MHANDHIQGGFTGVQPERGHLLRDGVQGAKGWPAPTKTFKTRMLIAGGGVAGLAAARALRLQGMNDFALLELEDAAGGNSRSGEIAGLPCPLGAHYLPLPGDDATEVQDLLEELGLRSRVAGRWQYDERHLCHSPQERLFFNGEWQDGLLPLQGVGADTLSQYEKFARLVEQTRLAARWTLPVQNRALAPVQSTLSATT
ncbi:MAG TPA: NAD(P)/FAD-dependent oxidoreductase, partial [Rhodoferax sp.]|nr:NAD(P)/FAD-dependent oxidoreductase [Rhodoferax sp.]